MEEKARQIAIKYVYGNHEALTDEQEVKDMTKDIVDLVKQFEAKNNESLHDVRHCSKCNQPLKGEKVSAVGYNICTCNWDTSNCG